MSDQWRYVAEHEFLHLHGAFRCVSRLDGRTCCAIKPTLTLPVPYTLTMTFEFDAGHVNFGMQPTRDCARRSHGRTLCTGHRLS